MRCNQKLITSCSYLARLSEQHRVPKKQDQGMADYGKDYMANNADPKNVQDLTAFVQTLLQQMQDKFQNMSDQVITRIDEMGNRIDDLEKNIADLMTQAGVDDRA